LQASGTILGASRKPGSGDASLFLRDAIELADKEDPAQLMYLATVGKFIRWVRVSIGCIAPSTLNVAKKKGMDVDRALVYIDCSFARPNGSRSTHTSYLKLCIELTSYHLSSFSR
jgi:hypothetical protein